MAEGCHKRPAVRQITFDDDRNLDLDKILFSDLHCILK